MDKKKRPTASEAVTSGRCSRSHTDTRTQHQKKAPREEETEASDCRCSKRTSQDGDQVDLVANGQPRDSQTIDRSIAVLLLLSSPDARLRDWSRHLDNAAALAPPSSRSDSMTVSFWLMLFLYPEYSCSPFFSPVAPSRFARLSSLSSVSSIATLSAPVFSPDFRSGISRGLPKRGSFPANRGASSFYALNFFGIMLSSSINILSKD